MGFKLVRTNPGIAHWCPACDQPHYISLTRHNVVTQSEWRWDDNVEFPTIDPQVRLNAFRDGKVVTLCHYTLIAGVLSFFDDCPHALADRRIALPDWPDHDPLYYKAARAKVSPGFGRPVIIAGSTHA